MSRSLPVAVVEAVNAQSTDFAFWVLVEITHSTLANPIRAVNNTEDVVSNGETYVAFPFSVILPPDTEDLQVRARIIIENATRDLIDEFRSTAGSRERLVFKLSVVASDDPDTVLQSISGLTAATIAYNAQQLSLDLSIDTLLTEPFPGDSFSPANFPGLF